MLQSQVERLVGAPIGKPYDRREPFMVALREQGVPINNSAWIQKVRSGLTQGRRNLLVLHKTIAQPNDQPKKDELYSIIAMEGVDIRTPGSGFYSARYSSNGYIEAVAQSLGLNPECTRKAVSAMRCDFAMETSSGDSEFEDFFKEIAETYLRANTQLIPPSSRSESVRALDTDWDRRSIASFYKCMYEHLGSGPRAIGGWVPYEIEVFKRFYCQRVEGANGQSTKFDAEVMKLNGNGDIPKLIGKLACLGVPANRYIFTLHQNALVYGSFALEPIEIDR